MGKCSCRWGLRSRGLDGWQLHLNQCSVVIAMGETPDHDGASRVITMARRG